MTEAKDPKGCVFSILLITGLPILGYCLMSKYDIALNQWLSPLGYGIFSFTKILMFIVCVPCFMVFVFLSVLCTFSFLIGTLNTASKLIGGKKQ